MIHEPKNEPLNEPEKMKNTRSTGVDHEVLPVDKSTGGELSTAQARAWLDGEKTSDPLPIHPDWQPNRFHRAKADALGLNLDVEADRFHAGYLASGDRKTGWGEAFGAFLDKTAAGRAEIEFSGIDEDASNAVVADHVLEIYEALSDTQTVAPTSPLPETTSAPEDRQETAETTISEDQPDRRLPDFDDRLMKLSRLREIKAALPLGWRPGERDQAEALIEEGLTSEAVAVALKQARVAHKTKRAEIAAELASRRPVPLPIG